MATEDETLRARAETAFNRYLTLIDGDPAPSVEEFIAGEDVGVHSELRRIISDYHSLRDSFDAPAALESGRVIGDFRLLQELGRGGMGVVWEAEQVSLGRRVAFKVLYPLYTLSPDALGRFRREGEAGARIDHPGIVAVHSVGSCEGTHYIAEQLVPGGYSLADNLADLREHKELPEGYYVQMAHFFAQVAEALQAAHDAGIIHRDVKPSNILIDEGGRPKVADFGLAKIQDELGLSRTGDMQGTPFYMSPEQATGSPIDHRTDVFSLGATLYEALTLTRPFDGDTSQQVLYKILQEDPPDPRSLRSRIPPDLAVICLEALEKPPDRRYQTMQGMADDLRRYLANEPIRAKPPGVWMHARKWVARHPTPSLGIGMGTAAFAIVSALLVFVSILRGSAVEAREDADRQAALYAIAAAADALESNDLSTAHSRLVGVPRPLRKWEWHYLVGRFSPAAQRLFGHLDDVLFARLDPSGAVLASTSDDGTVILWDAGTGEERLRIDVPARGLAFDPTGEILATAGDGGVSLWRVSDGTRIAALRSRFGKTCSRLCFDAAGRRIASVGEGGVGLWDTSTGEELAFFDAGGEAGERGAAPPASAAFSPDGSRLVIAGPDGVVRILETTSRGRVVLEPRPASPLQILGGVCHVAFTPDGEAIVACGVSGLTKVWDVGSRELLSEIPGEGVAVTDADLSPDGRWLATGDAGGGVRIRNLATGDLRSAWRAHWGEVKGVEFDPRGRKLVTASADLSVAIWDLAADLRTFEQAGELAEAAFSGGGDRLVTSVARGGEIVVWELADQGPPAVVGRAPSTIAFDVSDDGACLATIRLPEQGGVVTTTRVFVRRGPGEEALELETLSTPIVLALSPDGGRVAVSDEKGGLGVYDSATGRPIFEGRWPAMLRSLEFFHDGGRLAVGTPSGELAVWDLDRGEAESSVGLGSEIFDIEISPGGRTLATLSRNKDSNTWEVALWRVGEGRLTAIRTAVRYSSGLAQPVFSFHPDGSRLVCSKEPQHQLVLVDTRFGETVVALETPHPRSIRAARFVGRGGRRLVSIDAGWNLRSVGARSREAELAHYSDAIRLVDDLFGTGRHYAQSSAVEELLSNDAIDPMLRNTAILLASGQGKDPMLLLTEAWGIVSRPGLPPDAYAHALEVMEFVRETLTSVLNRDGSFILGWALLRNGRLEEAEAALEGAVAADGGHPFALAGLAITRHHLGKADLARRDLARLRELLRQPRWRGNEAPAQALREAEDLIGRPPRSEEPAVGR